MRDRAARIRSAVPDTRPPPSGVDPRIHVDLARLRALAAPARSLRLHPRGPARSVLNGRHASRLRGRGLNFEELRGYLPGDDVRAIDWKVTARTREPHVRVYTEERDRPALLVVDQRMSMFFGSRHAMKSVVAAEAAALAAFAIHAQGDRLGGIVFGDEGVADFRPSRSARSLDRLLTALAAANGALHADTPPVDPLPLDRPLEAAANIARRDHLILVLSDFDGIGDRTEALVGGLARRNDVILALVTDPTAESLPENLHLVVSDGRLQAELDGTTGSVRRSIEAFASGRIARVLSWETRLGVPILPLSAAEDALPQLQRLLGVPGRRR